MTFQLGPQYQGSSLQEGRFKRLLLLISTRDVTILRGRGGRDLALPLHCLTLRSNRQVGKETDRLRDTSGNVLAKLLQTRHLKSCGLSHTGKERREAQTRDFLGLNKRAVV